MPVSTVIQIRGKGSVTLPIELRRKYGLNEGDIFSLIDLGEGSFLLTLTISQLDRLGDRVREAVAEEGISLDEILSALDEEREQYYQQRYARD